MLSGLLGEWSTLPSPPGLTYQGEGPDTQGSHGCSPASSVGNLPAPRSFAVAHPHPSPPSLASQVGGAGHMRPPTYQGSLEHPLDSPSGIGLAPLWAHRLHKGVLPTKVSTLRIHLA